MKKDNYIEVTCTTPTESDFSVLIALLGNIGFEGFEEKDTSLQAYIPEDEFEEALIKELAAQHSFTYTVQTIAAQNWNAVWEENFDPVIVDDFVAIRAHFHPPVTTVQHEILITPKMSFGTGHHATTELMMQQMRNLDFRDKAVLDFGTGTGILAILAEKLGAQEILALDNDIWSIENSLENKEQNGCRRITIVQKDNADVQKTFDIILANINRNIILDNLQVLSVQLSAYNGQLLLSGLLTHDEDDILQYASRLGLRHMATHQKGQWILLHFMR